MDPTDTILLCAFLLVILPYKARKVNNSPVHLVWTRSLNAQGGITQTQGLAAVVAKNALRRLHSTSVVRIHVK